MSWQELHKPWHDTSVDYCDVCGNLLIRSFWEIKRGGEMLRACREGDERLLARLESFRALYPPIIDGDPFTIRLSRFELANSEIPDAKESQSWS